MSRQETWYVSEADLAVWSGQEEKTRKKELFVRKRTPLLVLAIAVCMVAIGAFANAIDETTAVQNATPSNAAGTAIDLPPPSQIAIEQEETAMTTTSPVAIQTKKLTTATPVSTNAAATIDNNNHLRAAAAPTTATAETTTGRPRDGI